MKTYSIGIFLSIQNPLNNYEVLSLVNTLKLKWGVQEKKNIKHKYDNSDIRDIFRYTRNNQQQLGICSKFII